MPLLTVLAVAVTSAPASSIEAGARALAQFQADEAVALLERARRAGPYRHDDHVRLYEQLGIAYAYLDRPEEALAAFDMLLALDPGHAVAYTLSPKATFLFEKARRAAAERPVPAIDVAWPRDLAVTDPIPITVEVVADPKAFLRRAALGQRLRGAPNYSRREFELLAPGAHRREVLDPPDPAAAGARTVEIYLVAFDERGNEVLRWGAPERPREVALRHVPPAPWYGRWWVWSVAAAVLAAGTGAAVYVATRAPASTVPTTLEVRR